MNEKLICEIYQTFYGKEPDFSEPNFTNLTIEMQAMAYILSSHGIVCTNYTFVKEGYVGLKLPMSMELQDLLIKLKERKKEDSNEKSVHLKEKAKKHISLVGEIIKKNIANTEEPIEALREIVYLNFLRNGALPSPTKEQLAAYSSSNEELIDKEECISIEIEIAKNNYNQTNLDSITRNIESGDVPEKSVRPIPNEQGPTKVFISEESRKKCVQTLLN